MAAAQKFDLLVIGGGPGGYTAAIRASQLGLKTAIIEKENLGGICLNWGCIPTKALLKSAALYDDIKKAADFGIMVQNVSFDFKKIITRSRTVSEKLSQGVAYLMHKHKITIFSGTASFADSNKITVKSETNNLMLEGNKIIIATGANPRALPNLPFDAKSVWNYRHALSPAAQPESLLIIGSGAIGVEFGDFYNTFGSKVTIIEKQPQILPGIDSELADIMHKALTKKGIEIHVGTSFENVIVQKDGSVSGALSTPDKQQKQSFAQMLVAIGVAPNTQSLNLGAAGVHTTNDAITINKYCQTNIPHIYAVGDVVGSMCLAHKAAHEAVVCVEHIMGLTTSHPVNKNDIPACIYAHPQIAAIGITEQEARSAGVDYKIGRFPYRANGKAIATGESEGIVKIIADNKTGEILGAHIIGDNATEIIHTYVAAKSAEATYHTLQQTIFAHPTLSEMLHEAALSLDNITLNL